MGLSYNPVKGEYENGTSPWSVTRIVVATFYKFGGGDPESTTGAFAISLLIHPAPA